VALRPAGVSLISISGFSPRHSIQPWWSSRLTISSPAAMGRRSTLFQLSKLRCCKIVRCLMLGSSAELFPVICTVLQGHGHRALQCPLREAVPKAAFPSTRLLAGRITIATIFKYRHARPKVFVPLDERCVGLPRRIGASKEHDLKSKILDGPGSVRRPLDLLRYETRSRQWLTRSRFSSA
jgi:hypothetical protein